MLKRATRIARLHSFPISTSSKYGRRLTTRTQILHQLSNSKGAACRQVSCAHALQSTLYHFILTYHLFWSLVTNCAITSPYWLCQQTAIASPPAVAPAGQFVHSPPKRYTPFAVKVLKSPLKLSPGASLLHISSAASAYCNSCKSDTSIVTSSISRLPKE